MLLQTNRLQIRPITAKDWKSMREIWADFAKSEYAQYDRPQNLEENDLKKRMLRWEEATKETNHMFFAVCLEDAMIGFIALNIRSEGCYELSYGFHSAYQGKGYAKESHVALFAYAKALGINRLIVGTALNNLPSVRFLTSLGFLQTGTEPVSFYQDAQGNDIFFDGGIFELKL